MIDFNPPAREGRDVYNASGKDDRKYFNPPAREGRDNSTYWDTFYKDAISTHPPVKGGTGLLKRLPDDWTISTHPPVKGGTSTSHITDWTRPFQPTRP